MKLKKHYLILLLATLLCFSQAQDSDATNHSHDNNHHSESTNTFEDRELEVMPFDLDKTMHIFSDTAFGGIQQVLVVDSAVDSAMDSADNAQQIQLIQEHLEEQSQRFAVGDFGDPSYLHGEAMPGLTALVDAAKEGQLTVSYEALPNGAAISYSSEDLQTIIDIHLWFQAQVTDHGSHATSQLGAMDTGHHSSSDNHHANDDHHSDGGHSEEHSDDGHHDSKDNHHADDGHEDDASDNHHSDDGSHDLKDDHHVDDGHHDTSDNADDGHHDTSDNADDGHHDSSDNHHADNGHHDTSDNHHADDGHQNASDNQNTDDGHHNSKDDHHTDDGHHDETSDNHHSDDGHHDSNDADDGHHDDNNDHHSDDHHSDDSDHHSGEGLLTDYVADIKFALRSEIVDAETMAYVGLSEGILDSQNPDLVVAEGDIVEITLSNTTVDEHDIVIELDGKQIHSEHVVFEDDITTFAFVADKAGHYYYYCSVDGHREAGMEGVFHVNGKTLGN